MCRSVLSLRRGRTLAGPPRNGTQLGRAAQCAAPTDLIRLASLGTFPILSGLRPSPLDKGSRPLKGKVCGRLIAAPTRIPGRSQTGPTGYAPGALAHQSQAQNWNRTDCNFCKLRAQWPGLNCGKPLRFCAPEGFCLAQGVTPVMGVRGKATMSTKCSSGAGPYPLCPFGTSPLDKGSRPRWRFGDFAAAGKVTRPAGRNPARRRAGSPRPTR